MAIYGIGANFNKTDVSQYFINNNVAGIGWGIKDAPDLHQFIKSLKVGDIIYIKSYSPSAGLIIKAIGIVKDDDIINIIDEDIYMPVGRRVYWICIDMKEYLGIDYSKLNVRNNSLYEEFHPIVQKFVLEKILSVITK